MLNEHGSLLRNTPTLWNAGLQKTFFHDSRTSSLDDLIREVLSNEKEMNTSASTVMQQLSKDPGYRNLLSKAWPNSDTAKVADAMVNAISMYLHTLVSFNSRFDQHIRGSKKNLTTSEVNGFNLFMGKARCGTCHFAPFFNGSKPTLYYYQESEVLGVPATSDKNNPVLDNDSGRFNSTKKVFHRFAFKTPTLRNIALTAPYMHNGVFKTLEEVVHFYNKGGGKGLGIALPNQSLPFDKLHLSVREIKDIISFMKSLTDTSGKSFQQMRTLVN